MIYVWCLDTENYVWHLVLEHWMQQVAFTQKNDTLYQIDISMSNCTSSWKLFSEMWNIALEQSILLCCLKVIFCLYVGTNSIMHLGAKFVFYNVPLLFPFDNFKRCKFCYLCINPCSYIALTTLQMQSFKKTDLWQKILNCCVWRLFLEMLHLTPAFEITHQMQCFEIRC